MASVVSICNLALSNLGKENIATLTEATAQATACNQFYEITRDTLLQSFHWSFAGKTASLAQVTNDKPGQWAYAYSKPSDCLDIRRVRRQYSGDASSLPDLDTASDELDLPYDIEGETIYTTTETAMLRYTMRLTDPTKFSPLFVVALSWHLSVWLAMPMTRDPKIRRDAFQIAQQMQGEAAERDANQTRATSEFTSSFLEARR
ncbi:hypothetical protein HF263_02955 [Rhizobium leguminosarum]|uniref:hypothetical protein n=1 Tax=Rhizobium leguminosarum TaxID=384 RepID=UPI001C90D35B|nr:hypothetical protein [Rhizobium leguminosarum]MBY3055038.1 hypothetical protein [Rhizobium leguminosarum]